MNKVSQALYNGTELPCIKMLDILNTGMFLREAKVRIKYF